MNKPLAIQLEFDIKTVRRAWALLSGEAMSDEELNAKFFDREPVKVDEAELFGGAESLQICAGFLSIISDEGKPTPKPSKSKFQQKLDEMAARETEALSMSGVLGLSEQFCDCDITHDQFEKGYNLCSRCNKPIE